MKPRWLFWKPEPQKNPLINQPGPVTAGRTKTKTKLIYMCNFHSTAWRKLGQDEQMLHFPHNSHAQMISEAGWRGNEPNRRTIVFEAEWDGVGQFPTDEKLVRNAAECPKQLLAAIRRYYHMVSESIREGKHLDFFGDMTKYKDIWERITTLPDGVTFPATCQYLYLRSDLRAKLNK